MLLEKRLSLSHSQNFLRDPYLIDHLLDRSTIQSHDLVYEVGPGTGIITERLARCCSRVVAIEKDRQLAAYLRNRFSACPNVTIHAADFLQFPLPFAPFKVFANIPYSCTAAIVGRLTAYPTAPLDSYLITQREAADRFVGSPRGTLYATLLYPWFAASITHRFRPTDFRPVPRVESVLLRLHRRDHPLVRAEDTQFFRDFVSYAFTASHPTIRATLHSCAGRSLAKHIMRSERLEPTATPSTVPGTLWLLLFEHLKDAGGVRTTRMVAGAEQRLRCQQSSLQKMHRTRVGTPGCKGHHTRPKAVAGR
jgi:16S rRNA A1518/A1519 N6-dimethyltransferase RsmA/KsgA/DIM1 with predicted DNA glycosylase/AP lyase activity